MGGRARRAAEQAERHRRLADASTWDGYRSAAFNKETGTLVVVLNAHEQGLDDDPENPWATFCDDHGRFVSHSTLQLARSHASAPTGWCEPCQGRTD